MPRIKNVTLTIAAITLTVLGAQPAHAFNNHRAAAVDQYGEATPTPTPTATPGQGPGNGQAASAGNSPPPAGGGNGRGPRGGSDDPGSDRERRGTRRRGSDGAGVAPDSVRNRPGAGQAGDVLPLTKPRGGKLPFTGLDLMLVVFLGVLLVVAGLALRLVRRRRPGGASAPATAG